MRPIPTSLLLSTALAAFLAPLPALAEDAALVLGIERYESFPRVRRADDVVEAAEDLVDLGFSLAAVPDAGSGNAISALENWVAASIDADRLIAVLAGQFINDGRRSWLMTLDADNPTLFNMGDRAVSVESVLRVLARRPNQSILFLAGDLDSGSSPAPYLNMGIGGMHVPPGVTVISGRPRAVANFLDEVVTSRGADIIAQARATPALSVSDSAPANLVLIPDTSQPAPPPAPAPQVPSPAEQTVWERARAANTVASYRDYIDRYPRGTYRSTAEDIIAALLADPNRAARLTEESLRLSVAERRAIQQDLTLLGYDTRGIDGVFGGGTRGAITDWQVQNGLARTAYLSREQIAQLDQQATRREAQIAAERQEQQAAAEREDRAYWAETGAQGDVAGYRAYLNRYPQGLYSGYAQTRLNELVPQQQPRADQQAFAAARNTDTVQALRQYLDAWPQGAFRDEASARIAQLNAAAAGNAQAEAAEQALGINGLTARLIETRLEQLGLNPGPVDGTLDANSRRAIRSYQQSNGLTASGYIDQLTLVRLLADTFSGR